MSTEKKQFAATADMTGMRLDAVAAIGFQLSRSSLVREFETGRILLNGERAKPRQVIKRGDLVEWSKVTEPPRAIIVPDLPILYEDDDVIVIDKPAGLNVHATEHGNTEATVADFSAERVEDDDENDRPGIVHRLDKDTSGVLILAKTPSAKTHVQTEFRQRRVYKRYIALVRGRLDPTEATINLPIGRDRKRPTRRAVVPGGRPAVTHYRVSHQYHGAALVDVELETGRTHQIRVHMAHLGHPVIADSLYGDSDKALKRQFLHAAEIKLTGPSSQLIHVTSKLPEDLQHHLGRLAEHTNAV